MNDSIAPPTSTCLPSAQLFVPEWQGFGLNDQSAVGADWLRRHLFGDLAFESVPIAAEEELQVESRILGRSSVVRNSRAMRAMLERLRPRKLFSLGGTCGIEVGPVSYLNQLHQGDLAVVWLDAHADLNTPQTSPSAHFHGMPLRALLGDGDPDVLAQSFASLKPQQVFLVGVRDMDPAERALVAAHSIVEADVEARDLVSKIRDAGFNHLYLHCDLDVLDPAQFDEMIFQVEQGMAQARLVALLNELSEAFQVVGTSLLEFVFKSGRHQDFLADLRDALLRDVLPRA